MEKKVYINGVLATSEDKRVLTYNILQYGVKIDVIEENGVQYVTTSD